MPVSANSQRWNISVFSVLFTTKRKNLLVDLWDMHRYPLNYPLVQLCTQMALAMAVRTVMTKLIHFLNVSFFMNLMFLS